MVSHVLAHSRWILNYWSLILTLHVVLLIFLILGRVSRLRTRSLRNIFASNFLRSADRCSILYKCSVPTYPVMTFSQNFYSVFWSLPSAVIELSVPAPTQHSGASLSLKWMYGSRVPVCCVDIVASSIKY